MCLAQGHNTVTPVRFEPAAPLSCVKHSTTEPLHSLHILTFISMINTINIQEKSLIFSILVEQLKFHTQLSGA